MESTKGAEFEDSCGNDSVMVLRIYTRNRLLYLGNLPVCSIFPSNLQLDQDLAPVFPGYFKDYVISTPPPRRNSLFDDAIQNICIMP